MNERKEKLGIFIQWGMLLSCFVLLMGVPTLATGLNVVSYSYSNALSVTSSDKQMDNDSGIQLLQVNYRQLANTMTGSDALEFVTSTYTDYSDMDASAESFLVYPSPFVLANTATLSYFLSKGMDIEIHVYNIMGRKITQQNYSANIMGGQYGWNEITLNEEFFGTNAVPASVYFFYILNDGKVLNKTKTAILP